MSLRIRTWAVAGLTLCATLPLPVDASIVTKDGLEWQQPADFTDLSWNTVAAVCPASSGFACSGTLKGIDLTGWTFAGRDLVWDLLVSYGMPDTAYVAHEDDYAGWLGAIMSDFGSTDSYPYLSGWTSTDFPGSGGVWALRVTTYFHPQVGSNTVGDGGDNKDTSREFNGSWFYRDPSAAVPVPATVLLLAPVVGLLAVRRRIGHPTAACEG